MNDDRRQPSHLRILRAAGTLTVCCLTSCGTARSVRAARETPVKYSPCESAPRSLMHRAKEIEDTLRRHRDQFLRTRQPEEVFAVFYYHVTAELRRRIGAGEVKFPVIFLEGLAEFYAAYEMNRTPSRREAHWQPYYEMAAKRHGQPLRWWHVSSPADVWGASGLIGLGVQAHIDFDLPRTLEKVLGRHPELTAQDLDELEREFDALGDIFLTASHRAFADVAAAGRENVKNDAGRISIRDRIAGWTVQRKRRRAWETWEAKQPSVIPPNTH